MAKNSYTKNKKTYLRPQYPLISIITIVYNRAHYLEETIQSVIEQKYPNFEYIIVDGASTDGTLDIIARYDNKINQWISEKDSGIADAMNKGIDLASGEYALFMHADDKFISNRSLLKLWRKLRKSNCKWCSSFYKRINSMGEVILTEKPFQFSFSDMVRADQIRHQTALVPLDVLKEVRFSKDFKYATDYDHFLKIWTKFGPPEIILDHIAYFRWDGNNLSSQYFNSMKDEMKVRLSYRKRSGKSWLIPFDYIIYALRKLKLIFYYIPKYKKSMR